MRIIIKEPSLRNNFYICNKCCCKMGDKKDCYKTNNKLLNNIHSFDYICKQCVGNNITIINYNNNNKITNKKQKKKAVKIIESAYQKYIKIIKKYEQQELKNKYNSINYIDPEKCESILIHDIFKNIKEKLYIHSNNNIYNNNLSLIGIMQKKTKLVINGTFNNIIFNKDGYLLNPVTNNVLYEFVITDKLSTLLGERDDFKTYCEYEYIPSKGLIMTNEIIYGI